MSKGHVWRPCAMGENAFAVSDVVLRPGLEPGVSGICLRLGQELLVRFVHGSIMQWMHL